MGRVHNLINIVAGDEVCVYLPYTKPRMKLKQRDCCAYSEANIQYIVIIIWLRIFNYI